MKTPEQRAQALMSILDKELRTEEDKKEFSAVAFIKTANSVWMDCEFAIEYREDCLQALCDALREKGYLD